MPLPSDEKLIALSQDLLKQFDTILDYARLSTRPCKGALLTGHSPSSEASLTLELHHLQLHASHSAVSSSTGLPQIPDNDPNANPRGLAVRFHLAEHVHTDIVSHSTDGFPTRTGQEFLEFLRAAASSDPSKPSPSDQAFLATHPKALAFVQTSLLHPVCEESYFGVTALPLPARMVWALRAVPNQTGREDRTPG
jgi:catalase